jgi:peptide/nickel transport system permease protein
VALREARELLPATVAGAGLFLAGMAVLYLATAGLDHSASWLRVLLSVFGLVVAYQGGRLTAAASFGSRADLPLGLSTAWLVLLAGAAILAPVLPLGEHVDSAKTIDVSSYLRPDLFSAHPLGTNQFGLDMLSRVIFGARESLAAATIAIVVGMIVGGILGIIAGYLQGLYDRAISIVTSIGLAFPPLVLLFVLAAVLGHNLLSVSVALSVLVIPGTIRFARANALSVGARDYTFSAYIIGASRRRVMVREVLPSVAATLTSLAFLTLPFLIVAEASLSFLGLGIRPPQPTWGNMIAEGNGGAFETNPFIVLVPGTALLLTALALNVIGQRLRSRWDPRQQQL